MGVNKEWQTGKPKERGKYLVTMECWVRDKERYVDIAYYGIMYGEKHECFYQSDSEWGDCKLERVLAWMPLPEPWKGETND